MLDEWIVAYGYAKIDHKPASRLLSLRINIVCYYFYSLHECQFWIDP